MNPILSTSSSLPIDAEPQVRVRRRGGGGAIGSASVERDDDILGGRAGDFGGRRRSFSFGEGCCVGADGREGKKGLGWQGGLGGRHFDLLCFCLCVGGLVLVVPRVVMCAVGGCGLYG